MNEILTTGYFFRFFLILFVLLSNINNSSALVPLESMMIGDTTQLYQEERDNPLNYIFDYDLVSNTDKEYFIKQLAIYEGFYLEGKNLENSCKTAKKIKYQSSWDEVQIQRSLLATLQYIGLDLTSRALPLYAKKFDFTKKDYSNLIDNLVGNYCSKNISSISRKELLKNLKHQYNSSVYSLPTIENNPLFTKKMKDIGDPINNSKKEFYFTMELFKRFCSWGGEEDELRLLVPLIKNPVIFSFLIRQMNNRSLTFDFKKEKILTQFNKNTIQVLCKNLVCRKKESVNFWNEIFYSIGSNGLTGDLERVYCQSFRDADYRIKNLPKKLSNYIKKTTLDDEVFTVSQFLSLVTHIPDFLLRSNRFTDLMDFSKSSMDKSFKTWAKMQNKINKNDILFEESMTVELIDRKLFYSSKKRKFAVHFDVNLGEFDRVNQKIGKITAGFRLKVSKKLLRWIISNSSNYTAKDAIKSKKAIIKRLTRAIEYQVSRAQKKFIQSPWKGNLTRLIVKELLTQLSLIKTKNYTTTDTGFELIPIKVHYGLFALKYLSYKHRVEKNRKRDHYLSSIFVE